MPSLRDIRQAITEVLDALDGVNVHAKAIDTVSPPSIEIVPVSGFPAAMNRGVVDWILNLIVTTDGDDAQEQLDDLISGTTDSIPALLHAAPTAGQDPDESPAAAGVTMNVTEQRVESYGARLAADGAVRDWRAVYVIRVLAKGTA